MSRTSDGRILAVDLTTNSSAMEVLSRDVRRLLGGGGALATWLLLRDTDPGLDPRDPACALVFAGGACAGTEAVGLSRCAVVAKSPLSGAIAESMVEGPFAHGLSAVDLDAIAITGMASEWSCLVVSGDKIAMVLCPDLVSLDTGQITDRLCNVYGAGAHVAAIGQAGVNGLDIASVVLDRAFPTRSGGLGAVMASKRLLAVVLVGAELTNTNNPDRPTEVSKITARYQEAIPTNPLSTVQYDPPGFGFWIAEGLEGYLGVENYRTASPRLPDDFAEQASALTLLADGSCPGCPQDCLKHFAVDGKDQRASVVHQEAVQAFTVNLGLGNVADALALNAKCHLLGIEQVAFSAALAAVMEAADAGALPAELEDIPARFGVANLSQLVDDVVTRRGAAALLGAGVAAMSERLPALRPYAMHVGGIAMVGFDPRGSWGQALVYALNPSGPRYDAVEHDIDFDPVWGQDGFIDRAAGMGVPAGGWVMTSGGVAKAASTARLWSLWSGYDALCLCLFAAPPTRPLTEEDARALVEVVTGWDVTTDEVFAIGERRLALQRRYNAREGLGTDRDGLPERFFTLSVDAGRLRGAHLDRETFGSGLREIRRRFGWSETTGAPNPATLVRLGLDRILPAQT